MKLLRLTTCFLLILVCGAGSLPDRLFNDNFYLYFENGHKDGVCQFKLPIKNIPVDTLEKYKAFNRCGFPIFDYSSNYNAEPQLAIYDKSRKKYFGVPLPFPHNHEISSVGIQLEEDTGQTLSTYLISGNERIYGSGGGTSYGGTIIISHDEGDDSITVHLKIRDFLSEEAFGRFGSKYSYQEYARPLLVENGNLYILPLDSQLIPTYFTEIDWYTNINAGVYKLDNGRLKQQSSISIY